MQRLLFASDPSLRFQDDKRCHPNEVFHCALRVTRIVIPNENLRSTLRLTRCVIPNEMSELVYPDIPFHHPVHPRRHRRHLGLGATTHFIQVK